MKLLETEFRFTDKKHGVVTVIFGDTDAVVMIGGKTHRHDLQFTDEKRVGMPPQSKLWPCEAHARRLINKSLRKKGA